MASRQVSKREIKKIRKIKNERVVKSNLKRKLKEYSSERFGSSSYWPWLELYTEIRGKFEFGWIPNDFYRVKLLNQYNPITSSEISRYKSFDKVVFGDFAICEN
jgi:hypothetical protein